MHTVEEPDPFNTTEEFERKHVIPKPGKTLIVGSKVYTGREDRRKRYAEVLGVDMLPGEGVDLVANLEQTPTTLPFYSFSHIECLSVLEHTPHPWLVTRNLEHLLEEEGTIFVTAPFVWRIHAYPNDYWRFTLEGLKSLFTSIEWKVASYAHFSLQEEGKLPGRKVKDYPYLARCNSCLFGSKRKSG